MTRKIRLKLILSDPPRRGSGQTDYVSDGPTSVRCIRTKDIDAFGRLSSEAAFLPRTLAERHLLEQNDLLITASATATRVFIYDGRAGEACFSNGLTRLRVNSTLCLRKYLYYCLLYSRIVEGRPSESGISENNDFSFPLNAPILVPEIAEQREIVAQIDRGANVMAHLLLELEGAIRIIQERDVALSDEMFLGPIMEDTADQMSPDWRVEPLQRVAQIVDFTATPPEVASDGIPVLTARDLGSAENGLLNTSSLSVFMPFDEYEQWTKRGTAEPGDVALSTWSPLGACVEITSSPVALAERLVLLKPKKAITGAYLRHYLTSTGGRSELTSRATGSTISRIPLSQLRDVRVVVPPIEAQIGLSSRLESASAKSGSLLRDLRAAIVLLQERNDALIANALNRFVSDYMAP